MPVIDLANPTRFLHIVNRVLPWLIAATLFLFVIGFYRVMDAPDDYQQGATVKIMFLHVPAAWLGMFGWGLMSVAALGTLVWRHPLADVGRQGCRANRCRLHADLPHHRFVVGPADLGNVLGVGCASDVNARPVSALSRRARPLLDRRRARVAARVPPRCCHWWAPSISPSSSSRSTGGIHCINPLRFSAWADRASILRC
jgi:hypothetical protein